MKISRLISGLIFLLSGMFFVVFMFFESWELIFLATPLIIIGIVILLNKNEDNIEKRKDLKEREYKK